MLIRLLRDIRKSMASSRQVIELDHINCLVNGRHGWFLANKYDKYLGQALVHYGECRELEHNFLTSLVKPGDRIVEVGANIGVHTVGLAKSIGPTGMIVAIEPQPAIHRVLNANIALNSLTNVVTHACGCGSRKESLIAPCPEYDMAIEHDSGGVSLSKKGAGQPISVVPLDELVGNMTPNLINIDVEGMELDVLKGAAGLIGRCRPILYVENDRLEKRHALIKWIQAKGYRLWWHMPAMFNPDNYFRDAVNRYPNLVSINMLCLPSEREMFVPDLPLEIVDAERDSVGIP